MERQCHMPAIIKYLQSVLLIALTSMRTVVTSEGSSCYQTKVYLEKLHNPFGIRFNGNPCDQFSPCDPLVYAEVVIENGNDPSFSLGVLQNLNALIYGRNTNVLEINKTVQKTGCVTQTVSSRTMGKLRVRVVDYDYLTAPDPVEDFDCLLSFPLNTTQSGQWSVSTTCRGLNQPERITLTYRSRIIPVFMPIILALKR